MSLHLTVTDLWTTAFDDPEFTRITLPEADAAFTRAAPAEAKGWEWGHIHGRLTMVIAGREVPHLGFWGPDDVCLDSWLPVLTRAVETLSASPQSEYTYDEGEQGQPAFHWTREGDEVRFSIVESPLSGAGPDPAWQRVPFQFSDLLHQVSRFQEQLRQEIKRQAPHMFEVWWKQASETLP